jgi:hypothetical protein
MERPPGFDGKTLPMQPEGFAPTVPAHAPIATAPIKPPSGKIILGAAAAGIALAGLLIGIAIGRATKDGAAAPAATNPQLAQLGVTSKPIDANVVIDGRFVGVSPVERIDLDPGKHSVVIDAFGYQPYAGTLEVEAKGRATLKVVLAPLGDGSATTRGEFAGAKTSATKAVPPTALMTMTGTGTSKDVEAKAGGGKVSRPPSAPARPKRDCSGERSKCRESCSSADFSCRSRCTGCGSCSTNWDECNRQCATCTQGCEQNVRFCESSCETQYNSCS